MNWDLLRAPRFRVEQMEASAVRSTRRCVPLLAEVVETGMMILRYQEPTCSIQLAKSVELGQPTS